MEHNPGEVFKLRTSELVWRQLGDEVMVLDAATSEYLTVNKTGATLWPLLMEGCRRADLTQTLVERFHIAEATAAGDAESFLSALHDLGLLEQPPGPLLDAQ